MVTIRELTAPCGLDCYNPEFKRKMGAERTMLMLPLNVVMVAKIQGTVDVEKLSTVLAGLRKRHALLAVRVVFDENDEAWYVSKGVPEFTIRTIQRESDDQWIQAAEEEYKVSFPLETGPLVRFTLLHSPDNSELVISGHHVVCDGMSLTYLIRDILQQLGEPGRAAGILPEPPPIDENTVPSPPSSGGIAGAFLKLLNKIWSRKNIRFDDSDLLKLHKVYWKKNEAVKVLAWEFSESDTEALVSRCRDENVTVNTALWTAFLGAQHDVQGASKPYHHNAGLAVSTRDKLNVPVGDAFGFYASSLAVPLKYDPQKVFWNMARDLREKIESSLEKTNIFRMLIAESLNPTFLDSLYFSKYGLMENKLSAKFLKKMGWDKITYGYAITNVGRMDIPTDYGHLKLEAVYGPSLYSDVDEKIVGVVTVGGKISFILTYNETNVDTTSAEKIRDISINYLTNAVMER